MFDKFKALGLSVAFVCGISTLLGAQANAEAYDPLPLEGKSIRVGMAITPPFVVVGNTFEDVRGIDYELVKELQRRTGFTIANDKIEILNFGQMINLGANGTLDMVAGGINLTPARHEKFIFSDPYYHSDVAVVGLRGSKIPDLKSLDNLRVAIVSGTNAKDLIPKDIKVEIVEVPTNFMAFYSVAYHKADVAIADTPLAQDFINNLLGKNLEIKFEIEDASGDMGLLFSKHNPEVHQVLTKAFTAMIEDGTVSTIVSRFSNNHEANITTARAEAKKEELAKALILAAERAKAKEASAKSAQDNLVASVSEQEAFGTSDAVTLVEAAAEPQTHTVLTIADDVEAMQEIHVDGDDLHLSVITR